MKTALVVIGAVGLVYVAVRVAKALAAGSPVAVSVLHPRAPLIALKNVETRRGAGHF
jgi:hypothetical protein